MTIALAAIPDGSNGMKAATLAIATIGIAMTACGSVIFHGAAMPVSSR